ncbi:MAG TPA: phospholipase D-like domain-containing protein [Kofleriaceae bacterium]|nr:phospholipase D-like domain-containing protein [Kofleriaceae bacterium]
MLPKAKLVSGTKLRALRTNELWSDEKFRARTHYVWPPIQETDAPQALPPRTVSGEYLAAVAPGRIFTVQEILYEATQTIPSTANPNGAAYQCIRATMSIPTSSGTPKDISGFIYTTYNGVDFAELYQDISVVIEPGKVTVGQAKVENGKLVEYTKTGEQPTDDIPDSIWVSKNKFKPPRYGDEATVYVDGEGAMAEMAAVMMAAAKSIYITGWWISPDIIMTETNKSLKDILSERAAAGVLVKLLLFDPPDIIGLGLDEDKAEDTLENLFPARIHVVRVSPGIRWSHHQKTVVVDEKCAFLGGVDLARGRRDTYKHPLAISATTSDNRYNPQVDNIEQSAIRMPWHDIHVKLMGKSAVDVAHNFVQRWNSSLDQERSEAIVLRRSNRALVQGTRAWNLVYHPAAPITALGDADISANGSCAVQIARTFGSERGIEEMYLNLIGEAKTYIHIEQQFFSSLLKEGNENLNKVVSAICGRLERAISKEETFRVYIIIPQYPEGILDKWSVQELMHWQYQTIIRGEPKEAGKEIGPASLYGRGMQAVRKKQPSATVDECMLVLNRYVKFFNLVRSEKVPTVVDGGIGERWYYSQIYVHAKAMIVDDRYAIIGSANINDRSLLGDRDTEIAALIGDRTVARNLRVRLWKEHLGLLGSSDSGWTASERNEMELLVEGDLSDLFHDRILEIAKVNTSALEATFPGFPRDAFAELSQQRAAETTAPGNPAALQTIRGHLTLFPLYWLRDEDLATTGFPDEIFSFNTGQPSVTSV